MSADHAQIVDMYRAAVARGDTRPNRTVAEATGIRRRTVEAHVYWARKAGEIPPTTRGRAVVSPRCPTCGQTVRDTPTEGA